MPSYVVTGANRGLGLEFVKQLSVKSENIIIALVRDKSAASDLVNLHRTNVHLVQADIVDFTALKAAAAETAKITGGSLDVLINNAAFVEKERRNLPLDGYPAGQEQLLEDDIMNIFRINNVGVIHTINAFLPLVKKGSAKKVIVLSSGVGDLDFALKSGDPTSAPYCISKAAVNVTVAKYANQYKTEGIIFLAISPGLVNTATKPPTPEQVEQAKAMVKAFKNFAPDFEGPITPKESISMMFKVFDRLTIEDSGTFISHKGNKEWL